MAQPRKKAPQPPMQHKPGLRERLGKMMGREPKQLEPTQSTYGPEDGVFTEAMRSADIREGIRSYEMRSAVRDTFGSPDDPHVKAVELDAFDRQVYQDRADQMGPVTSQSSPFDAAYDAQQAEDEARRQAIGDEAVQVWGNAHDQEQAKFQQNPFEQSPATPAAEPTAMQRAEALLNQRLDARGFGASQTGAEHDGPGLG